MPFDRRQLLAGGAEGGDGWASTKTGFRDIARETLSPKVPTQLKQNDQRVMIFFCFSPRAVPNGMKQQKKKKRKKRKNMLESVTHSSAVGG